MTLTAFWFYCTWFQGQFEICVFQISDLKQGHKNNKNISCPSRMVKNCVSLKNILVSRVRLDGTSYSRWKLTGENRAICSSALNYRAAAGAVYSHAHTAHLPGLTLQLLHTVGLGVKWNLAAEINSLFIWRSNRLLTSV